MKTKFLTMNIYINAWLDCSNPFISLHNKLNDDLLAHFNTEKVKQLIDNGEIYIEDLQSTNEQIQLDVVTNLLAIKTNENIKKQMGKIKKGLKQRDTIATEKPIKRIKRLRPKVIDLFPSSTLQSA